MKTFIHSFLNSVDRCFPIPLSQKQNLAQYAGKLSERATICTASSNGKILSMVAGYTDHVEQNLGYISIVATLEEARGQGLASKLVCEFLEIARSKGLDAVHLYAVASNKPAVHMYRRLGFVDYMCENEPRPDDLHMIYYLRGKK